jgi:hypothetical protein
LITWYITEIPHNFSDPPAGLFVTVRGPNFLT